MVHSFCDTPSNACANDLGIGIEMRYKSNVRSIEREFDAFPEGDSKISAMTVPLSHAHRFVDQPRESAASTRPCRLVEEATAPSEWRLTDRGIAVVVVVAVMILTAALGVIGLTAVRVTSADYGADVHTSQVDQH